MGLGSVSWSGSLLSQTDPFITPLLVGEIAGKWWFKFAFYFFLPPNFCHPTNAINCLEKAWENVLAVALGWQSCATVQIQLNFLKESRCWRHDGFLKWWGTSPTLEPSHCDSWSSAVAVSWPSSSEGLLVGWLKGTSLWTKRAETSPDCLKSTLL